MKLTKGVYTREASGFQVMVMEAPRAHRGGVSIFYHDTEHFSAKELRFHSLNVISFQLVTGRRQWYGVGCYISPINA